MDRDRILVVDDEEPIRLTLSRLLSKNGYVCAQAGDVKEALRQLAEQEFELVLSDVNMPGESGLDLVRQITQQYSRTAVVMVTGVDDAQIARMALDTGAYGYVVKPFEANEILINVSNALRRRALEIESRNHLQELERVVLERTLDLRHVISELRMAGHRLRSSHEETIMRLSRAAEFRDRATAMHTERISSYSAFIAGKMGLPDERTELIRIASPMHDIGKVGISDDILLKPGSLTSGEFEAMKTHADIGYRILHGSEAELLDLAGTIAWSHHEKVDGTGYPMGLIGEDIPVEGRIVAVADVFDALSSDRVYRSALPIEKVMSTMQEGRGLHFDPQIFDLFVDSMDEVLAIKAQYGG